jgi:hypothetical protein
MMAQIMATYTPTGGISVFPSDQVVEDAILALEGLSTATAYPTAPQTPSPSAPAPPTQSSAGDAGTCRAVEGVVSCGRATGMEQEKGAGGRMGESVVTAIMELLSAAISATVDISKASVARLLSPNSQWSRSQKCSFRILFPNSESSFEDVLRTFVANPHSQ